MIKVRYESIDGVRRSWSYKTLAKAHAKAVYLVGAHPEEGRFYAVSGDGVGKVTVDGCSIAELFADPNRPKTDDELFEEAMQAQAAADRAQALEDAKAYAAEMKAFEHDRSNGCRCSDTQLTQVGCDCPASAEAFALVESYLVPDDYGGERGARRLARTCATLAEAETAARLKGEKAEAEGYNGDNFFLVTYRIGDRWYDDYGPQPPRGEPLADPFADMPF